MAVDCKKCVNRHSLCANGYCIGYQEEVPQFRETPIKMNSGTDTSMQPGQPQQLKAKIAAFANELDSFYIKDCDLANAKDLVKRMRQLSLEAP